MIVRRGWTGFQGERTEDTVKGAEMNPFLMFEKASSISWEAEGVCATWLASRSEMISQALFRMYWKEEHTDAMTVQTRSNIEWLKGLCYISESTGQQWQDSIQWDNSLSGLLNMQDISEHMLINIHLQMKSNYTQISYRRLDNNSSTLLEHVALWTWRPLYNTSTPPSFQPNKNLKEKINSFLYTHHWADALILEGYSDTLFLIAFTQPPFVSKCTVCIFDYIVSLHLKLNL